MRPSESTRGSSGSLRVEYDPLGKKSGASQPAGRSLLTRLVRGAAWLAVALVLPFLVLVRVSVHAYGSAGLGGWSSILVGALSTVLLLLGYLWLVRVRFQGRLSLPRSTMIATLTMVLAYMVFTLVFLSAENAKSPDVRRHYRSLHPVLRVATGTVLLFDRRGVITDLRRSPEDYRKWGLPVNEASLHFEQPDGFVHALDLRTVGRPVWQVGLMHAYFRLTGFSTLRHVGTADHLHVSLPLHTR